MGALQVVMAVPLRGELSCSRVQLQYLEAVWLLRWALSGCWASDRWQGPSESYCVYVACVHTCLCAYGQQAGPG